MSRARCLAVLLLLGPAGALAQTSAPRPIVIVPQAVWDGQADAPKRGWVVVVNGARIQAVGPDCMLLNGLANPSP